MLYVCFLLVLLKQSPRYFFINCVRGQTDHYLCNLRRISTSWILITTSILILRIWANHMEIYFDNFLKANLWTPCSEGTWLIHLKITRATFVKHNLQSTQIFYDSGVVVICKLWRPKEGFEVDPLGNYYMVIIKHRSC